MVKFDESGYTFAATELGRLMSKYCKQNVESLYSISLFFADLQFESVKKFPMTDPNSDLMQLIELVADTAEFGDMRVRCDRCVHCCAFSSVLYCRQGEKMILNA